MTDTFKVLYEPIPDAVSGKSRSGSNETKGSELKDYLSEHFSVSERNEIDDECKKTFPLHRQKAGEIKKPQSRYDHWLHF